MTAQIEMASANAVLIKDGHQTASRDTRALMAFVLGVDASRMTLHLHDELSAAQQGQFWTLVQRRLDREPVSHLIGARMFYGRTFIVTPDVLDPRPETETLIAAALGVEFNDVLDLGTGSGCILLTLLTERKGASGIGIDVSEQALDVARRNCDAVGVADRCAFAQGDWFVGVGGTYDLIVSNPPYIASEEMAGLAPELGFEPRVALTDEADGLSCYREIAAGAGAHLMAGGWLMVEIGPTQASAVCGMFTAAGFVNVGICHDLDGRNRVVVGQKTL